MQTPFMTVTRWRPDRSVAVPLHGPLPYKDLLAQLESHFPSPNIFYAVRLAGRFDWVKARSVRKQEVDRQAGSQRAEGTRVWGRARGSLAGLRFQRAAARGVS